MRKLFVKAQDPVSCETHALGAAAALGGGLLYLLRGGCTGAPAAAVAAAMCFCLSMVALYAASAIYHYYPGNAASAGVKRFLRKMDHSMIYVLIAGSYTPFCVVLLPQPKGTRFCLALWGVALAGVLAMRPRILVLDEPTAGLDPAGRENLMANIRDYHRNKKRTIILVSHSMDEIARNVDRILVLKNAHVLMSGAPAEVFARAEELLSAGLDVPQVTQVARLLREKGLPIDPAVYTVEALERELLALREGGASC